MFIFNNKLCGLTCSLAKANLFVLMALWLPLCKQKLHNLILYFIVSNLICSFIRL